MPRPRFAAEGEEVTVSLPHALQLASASYGFLKDNQPDASLKTLGILIGYLRGDKEMQ